MTEKQTFRLTLIIGIVVALLVVVLNENILPRPANIPTFTQNLPLLNAFINGTCFFLLLVSLNRIKNKKIEDHKKINISVFFLSSLFLVSYVFYHWLYDETSYGGEGSLRTFYYLILISHILLAAVVLPLVLMSFYYALNKDFEKHKRITRFSYPIWLYVTFTGVIVYLMIQPFYKF